MLAGGALLVVSLGLPLVRPGESPRDEALASVSPSPSPAASAGASPVGSPVPVGRPTSVPAISAPAEGEAQQRQVIPPSAVEGGSRPASGPGFQARALPPERLVIPAIDLDSRVIPLNTRRDPAGGLVWETAAFAVGHHLGTANPGEPGNTVLSGHISSRSEGAVFRRLPEVKPGVGVIVFTAQQPYVYRVRDTRVVTPASVEVLESTGEPMLTLITCVPDGVYTHRLVVRAEAVRG